MCLPKSTFSVKHYLVILPKIILHLMFHILFPAYVSPWQFLPSNRLYILFIYHVSYLLPPFIETKFQEYFCLFSSPQHL